MTCCLLIVSRSATYIPQDVVRVPSTAGRPISSSAFRTLTGVSLAPDAFANPWTLIAQYLLSFSNGNNCQSHWSNLGCLWGAHPLRIAELCNVHTCCFVSLLGKLISITDRLKAIIYNSSYLDHMQPLFIFSLFPNSHYVGESPDPGLLLPKVSIYFILCPTPLHLPPKMYNTKKNLVSWIVLLMASLVISWI
jgi:hypothetical protein